MIPLPFSEGAVCIIGSDAATAIAIEAMGGLHETCTVGDIVIDQQRKLLPPPPIWLTNNIGDTSAGIRNLVNQALQLT